MKLEYASEKLKTQCTSLKAAQRLFGGNKALAISLLARVNALESADTIKDIIVQPTFRFHNLHNKKRRDLEGFFAIDVNGRRDAWRIVIQPLDHNKKPYNPCNIDEIAGSVRIVEIAEVSKHYE